MGEQGSKRILVVDDEPDAVEFVKVVLEEVCYTVIAASDGDEGIQKARAQKPDLVVLDVQMPRKDGFTVFAEMRHDPKLADVPVVMLTGVGDRTGIHFSAQDMGDFLGHERDAYVEKPVDPERLQRTVKDILAC